MRFTDKVALVTGGAGAIGRATVLRFASEGADVVVVDRAEEQARQVAAEVEAAGRKALSLHADVTVPDDHTRVVQAVMEQWGHLDIVFANAGISGSGDPVRDLAVDDWNRII